jgi:hypothetical protein
VKNVAIVTTLPNSALARQVSNEVFQARINVSKEALLADLEAGYKVVALLEPAMKDNFSLPPNPNLKFVDDIDSANTPMGVGRRKVIAQAIKWSSLTALAPFVIVWREPEKNLAKFVPDLVRPIQDGDCDIVIPRRKSLKSYPSFSQDWEIVGNLIASTFIGGKPQDYWVGPRAFNIKAAQYFLDYPGEQKGLPDLHDSIFCPLIDASLEGLKVSGVEIDFEYPKEQREAEENDTETMKKRMKTMRILLQAMRDRLLFHKNA